VDRNGKQAQVLTLQTREDSTFAREGDEQHLHQPGVVRARATAYLTALGPQDSKGTADLCLRKAHYAAGKLAQIPGVSLKFDRPFFKEFTLSVPGGVPSMLGELLQAGYRAGLHLGRWYPTLDDCVSVAVTEKRTKAEIGGLAAAFAGRCRAAPYAWRG
jgi:glycine dehydrogenase subunit 1